VVGRAVFWILKNPVKGLLVLGVLVALAVGFVYGVAARNEPESSALLRGLLVAQASGALFMVVSIGRHSRSPLTRMLIQWAMALSILGMAYVVVSAGDEPWLIVPAGVLAYVILWVTTLPVARVYATGRLLEPQVWDEAASRWR
jgi:hypothetical protein